MNKEQLLNLSLTDMSFKDLLALFRRRRGIFLSILTLALLAGVLASLLLPPSYMSLSQVIIEGRTQANPNNAPGDIESALTNVGIDYDVATQIRILSSFQMIYSALKKVGYPLPQRITEDEFKKLPQVDVQQIGTTNAVQLSVEYQKPEVANQVALSLPLVYRDFVLERQRDQVKRSIEFVTSRLSEEQEALRTLQQEFATFKTQNNVVDSQTETQLRVGNAAQAERDLSEAEGDVEAIRQQLAGYESLFASTPKTLENPATRRNVDTIDREATKLADLRAQRESVLVNNYPDSDRVKRIDAAIGEQEKTIKNMKETVDVTFSQRNPQLDYLLTKIADARAGLGATQAKASILRDIARRRGQELVALAPISSKQRDSEVKIDESEKTITRLKSLQNDIQLRDNAVSSPVTDLTGATPAKKVRPNWFQNLALALVVGTFLGALAAIVRDLGLDRVNTATEATLIADKDVLARIPLRSAARDPLIADPQRAKAFEAYRILRSSILLAAEKGSKAFIVTSTVPREGKTVVAGNLAVAMALDGKKTVLVDGNLRKPMVHRLFKVDSVKGVAEVAQGSMPLDEALKQTDIPNLHVLTCGAEVSNPTELVASEGMGKLLEELKSRFDIVLVDSASGFGYADTQSLVSQVKDVVYVVQVEGPSKTQMREASGMIEFAGGKILGLVVNKDPLAARRMR